MIDRRNPSDIIKYACVSLAPSDYTFDRFDGIRHLHEDDAIMLAARHDCGAMAVVRIDAVEMVSAEHVIDLIRSRLFGSCYCVRREVFVPCTFQKCEAAS